MELSPMENKDLLSKNNDNFAKAETNGQAPNGESSSNPPDGGIRAYMIVAGSFLTNGLVFGIINSYSVIFSVLKDRLKEANVPDYESKAAFVGSLSLGTTFLLSPISGILTGLMGLRFTAVTGGVIAVLGLLISSFVANNVNALYFTYGFVYGLGASLAYTPSLAILGQYFKRYLGLVNGIVTIGSSVFTVFMAPLMKYTLDHFGLEGLFRMLAVITLCMALCGFLFKPISIVVVEKPSRERSFKVFLKSIINVQVWKISNFRWWALSMPIALFGYFVPYVYNKDFVESNFKDVLVVLPLQCMAGGSGVGRLIFGILADKKWANRLMMQQMAFYIFGIFTIILPFVTSFPLLVVMFLVMGIFDGAFVTLIGPIAIQFCGSAYAAQSIGCMLGISAFPLSLGPAIAGRIHSATKTYTLPFILAGISQLIGATLMFAIKHKK
uniref:Karmoisin n=1 Tax=Limenitis arthemis astyanax TaxID=324813 RepID=A0A6B9UQY7_LIMAT|nr:karmoisin [Limenitis arthemis astyanax]